MGPHQIARSSLGGYVYDTLGNQYVAPGRNVEYKSFGLPRSVSTDSRGRTTFAYDDMNMRVLKISGHRGVP